MTLPIDQIERAIQPTEEQVALLKDLEVPSTQARSTLQSSCPTEVPLTPIGRLDTVGKRIRAMIEAVRILRAPLMKLYDSLEDDQKDRFSAIGLKRKYRHAGIARDEFSASYLGGLCKQQVQNFTLAPVQRVEQTIKPAEEQKAVFNLLKEASINAAISLDSSCPADLPETLIGRLRMVAKRLDALADAVDTVKPAL